MDGFMEVISRSEEPEGNIQGDREGVYAFRVAVIIKPIDILVCYQAPI